MPTKAHQEISVHQLADKYPARAEAAATHAFLFPHAAVQVPAIQFGDPVDATQQGRTADFAATWGQITYESFEVWRWRIRDATVHGPHGAITVGNFVLAESLIHVPFHLPGYGRSGDRVLLPKPVVEKHRPSGHHAISGNAHNYYHWMLDILPKLQIRPFHEAILDGVVVMPRDVMPFQTFIFQMLEAHGHGIEHVGAGEALHLSSLGFIPNMTACGAAPHPALTGFFRKLMTSSSARQLPPRAIYISRVGCAHRQLMNESAVIELAASHGFDICQLEQIAPQDQMSLFASATHIMAPHGAGLANIVFANPGAKLLELHMESYVNWCFRKLASLQNIQYGAVVGRITDEPQGDWVHLKRWVAPLKQIEDILSLWCL